MPDSHEAARQDVQEKPTEEFLGVERHDFRAPAIGIVLPVKAHDASGETHEPRVGHRDAMGVAPEVLQHLLRPRERAFRIDHPGRGPQLRDEGGKAAGFGQGERATCEGEGTLSEGAVERVEVLGAEDDRERRDGKQKRWVSTPPACPVARERPAGHKTVDVQMLSKRLTPSMEDRR